MILIGLGGMLTCMKATLISLCISLTSVYLVFHKIFYLPVLSSDSFPKHSRQKAFSDLLQKAPNTGTEIGNKRLLLKVSKNQKS